MDEEAMLEEAHSDLFQLEDKESNLLTDHDAIAKAGLATDRLPESFQEAAIAEKILSEELANLSLMEQEQVIFDAHGMPQLLHEDPPNIDEYLEKFENEIRKIRGKKAYERARYLNEEYVTDRAFRLRFLRCDQYIAKLAAQRFVYHFKIKEHLFGKGEILGRDVRLADLSPDDTTALECGFVQILPSRDAAGRPVLAASPMYSLPGISVESHHRSLWYILNTNLMKDEDAQLKGIVAVLFNTGSNARAEPLSLLRSIQRIRSAIPKKFASLHFCYDNPALKPYAIGMHLCMGKELRKRSRMHFGNYDTILFELQTYGIPVKEYPVKRDGTLSVEWHKDWIKALRYQEEKEENTVAAVIVPRRFDVLFGRSKFNREHTGNLRAYHLVEMFKEEYDKAGKLEKTAISERVVRMVHDSYGRFLKWEEGGWEKVDKSVAREKISHFFRQLRSKKASEDADPIAKLRIKRVSPGLSPSPTDDA